MAKYFLGSVGTAEAFRKNAETGKFELAFVSKTLTDSGLNISTTKDDIRAGQGAPIQFSFYHDPSVEITLTDVLWDKNYLTAQLGAEFTDEVAEAYMTKNFKFTSGIYEIQAADNYIVKPLPIPCGGGEQYIVWGAKAGTDEWFDVAYDENANKFTLPNDDDLDPNGNYCIRTLVADDRAQIAEISSLIIPEELFLIIKAPIFAGDSCAASQGKAAGSITFEVPRFQLNGSQEFSMNMSSNQTMSLAGIALASTSADCDAQGGKLLRVIEVIDNEETTWQKGIISLIVDEDSMKENTAPVVYGERKDGTLRKINNTDLTFTPELTGGKFAKGLYTITLTKNTEVTEIVEVDTYLIGISQTAGSTTEYVVIVANYANGLDPVTIYNGGTGVDAGVTFTPALVNGKYAEAPSQEHPISVAYTNPNGESATLSITE